MGKVCLRKQFRGRMIIGSEEGLVDGHDILKEAGGQQRLGTHGSLSWGLPRLLQELERVRIDLFRRFLG